MNHAISFFWVSAFLCCISVSATQENVALFYQYATGTALSTQAVVTLCTPANCIIEDSSGNIIGSGVMVHPSGIMLTNVHVLENCRNSAVTVKDCDRRRLAIQGILTFDLGMDWVAVKMTPVVADSQPLHYVQLGDPARLQPGQMVVAIGNSAGYANTPSFGPIHSASQCVSGIPQPVIRHGATIIPGNSGGGLYDLSGGLIGINFLSHVFRYTMATNFGWAIPISTIRFPRDTTALIPLSCFCEFLGADSLISKRDPVPDWKDARDILMRALSECSDFPVATLLLAQCEINLNNPERALDLAGSLEQVDNVAAKAKLVAGQAWLKIGVLDTTSRVQALDSAKSVYGHLKVVDTVLADSLLAEINRAQSTHGSNVTLELSTNADNDSSGVGFVGPVEQHLNARFGPEAVSVFTFMGGKGSAEVILRNPRLTQLRLLEILQYLRDEGMIKVDSAYLVGSE